MGKKFVVIGGKKYYLKEAEGEESQIEEEPAIEEEEGEEGEEEAADEAVEKEASKIAKKIMSGLKLGEVAELKKQVDALAKSSMSVDSKLAQILNGKDYVKDRDNLTANEKIVGFFHALVTRNEHATKALAEGVNADGGYLFPAEFQAELIKSIAEFNVMRQLVRVVTMKRNVKNIPTLTSSVQVTWTAENAAKSTTTARFGQATLTARKMAAIIYASDELIEDSTEIDVVETIISLFAEAIANEEEKVIILGNGTTQPTGLETARGAGDIAAIAAIGQDFDDIIALEHSLPAKYSVNGVYLANRTTIKNLRTLKDTDGRYIWSVSTAAGAPATLNGKPIYEQNWLPNGVIYFGDFKRGYWLGDRRLMTVKVTQDTETAFTKDQTAIRVVERIAGNVVLGESIKALTGF